MNALRNKAKQLADEFLDCAADREAEARVAADYTLAAKNAMSVVLACVQAEATQAKSRRELR